jgi:hypothetical protein
MFRSPKSGLEHQTRDPAHVLVHHDQNPPKKAKFKPYDITQENTGKAGLKDLQDMLSTLNKNRPRLKVSSQETENVKKGTE